MKKLILLLLIPFFASCVGLKPARNIDNAENKIIKYNKGINNQIERFPELVKDAFTTVELDSTLVQDSLIVENDLQDFDELNEIEEAIDKSTNVLMEAKDILETVYVDNPVDKAKLKEAKYMIESYKEQSDSLFKKYTEAAKLNNQFGIYETEKYTAKWKLNNGRLTQDIKIKDKYVVYEKTKTINSIDIRKDFWQDKKFYFLFVIPLLTILFFLGGAVQQGLQSIVSTIIKFVRKIFTGGI